MHFPRNVVMFPHLTWYADDNVLRHVPTPAGLLDRDRWAEIVLTYAKKWDRRDGVIVVSAKSWAALTAKQRMNAASALVAGLHQHGWTTSTKGAETGWFTCRKPGGRAGIIMFGVLPWMDQGRTTLFDLDASAVAIARRLGQYRALLGVTWRGTGGTSGTALLRSLYYHRQQQPRWRWDSAPSEVHGCSFELLGNRHHRPVPDGTEYVHLYDTRAMYLAGALVAECAWDPPEQRGPQEFDPQRPGYWKIDTDWIGHLGSHPRRLTTLLLRRRNGGGMEWVTTPVMRYLAEQLGQIEVHDSITADRQSRIFREWAERVRDARDQVAAGDPELLPAVKDTYARTVGMLRKTTSRVYRPDWRDTIVDTAKVNLIRKVMGKADSLHWPIKWNVDAVWVPTANPIVTGSLFGDQGRIGGLRHVRTYTIDEYNETEATHAQMG